MAKNITAQNTDQFSVPQTGALASYFSNIRTREEVLQSIANRPDLNDLFRQWSPESGSTAFSYFRT